MSVNKAIVVGRLGADPELKYSKAGNPYTRLSIATNHVWNDKNGQKQEKTEWHRVVFFGKQAETCGEYLTKGRQVYVEGRLETDKWTDDDGNNRYTTNIIGSRCRFLSGGGGGNQKVSDGDIPF